jgi:hypothetical protein
MAVDFGRTKAGAAGITVATRSVAGCAAADGPAVDLPAPGTSSIGIMLLFAFVDATGVCALSLSANTFPLGSVGRAVEAGAAAVDAAAGLIEGPAGGAGRLATVEGRKKGSASVSANGSSRLAETVLGFKISPSWQLLSSGPLGARFCT